MKKSAFLPWCLAIAFLSAGTTLHFTNAAAPQETGGEYGATPYGSTDFNGTPTTSTPTTSAPTTSTSLPAQTTTTAPVATTTTGAPLLAVTTTSSVPETTTTTPIYTTVPEREPVAVSPVVPQAPVKAAKKQQSSVKAFAEKAQDLATEVPRAVVNNAVPVATETTKTFAIPSSLIICTTAFLVLVHRADRRDPKLRKAPVDRSRTVLLFEEFDDDRNH